MSLFLGQDWREYFHLAENTGLPVSALCSHCFPWVPNVSFMISSFRLWPQKHLWTCKHWSCLNSSLNTNTNGFNFIYHMNSKKQRLKKMEHGIGRKQGINWAVECYLEEMIGVGLFRGLGHWAMFTGCLGQAGCEVRTSPSHHHIQQLLRLCYVRTPPSSWHTFSHFKLTAPQPYELGTITVAMKKLNE